MHLPPERLNAILDRFRAQPHPRHRRLDARRIPLGQGHSHLARGSRSGGRRPAARLLSRRRGQRRAQPRQPRRGHRPRRRDRRRRTGPPPSRALAGREDRHGQHPRHLRPPHDAQDPHLRDHASGPRSSRDRGPAADRPRGRGDARAARRGNQAAGSSTGCGRKYANTTRSSSKTTPRA